MWMHASPRPLNGLAALAVRALRVFPQRLPAEQAARVLAELGEPAASGDGLVPLLMSRRLSHVVRAVCGELDEIGGAGSDLTRLQQVATAMADLHLEQLRLVQAELGAKGVPVLVPKGVFYAATVYPHLEPPFSTDVDLLVRSGDFDTTCDTLRRLGYIDDLIVRANVPLKLPPAVAAREGASFGHFGQSRSWVKLVRTPHLDEHADFIARTLPGEVVLLGGQVHLCALFDVHHNLNSVHDPTAAAFRPTEADWWQHPQRVAYRGVAFDAISDVTAAWFAANHFYTDVMLYGDPNLKILGDLAALTRAGRVDWPALADIAQRHVALRPPLGYVFRMLGGVFGCEVPGDFLAALAVPAPRNSAHFADFGDPLARVLDLPIELTVGEHHP
ncbi:hypothetical protein Cme02nite_50580 [Catellatospora methionotrophica]|uniref:Uncharacterized protein n=1 Tax=Catellatospora methionotrophica TaxID=121620 RepID=A0A8J3PGF2_9ACTN|nr:nucleotidyltransferase family protein [Catellatospora methionotrophica]GIG16726.1 hypothetical protein Cme02nite_50580 [Catellatospora methionotrophica]